MLRFLKWTSIPLFVLVAMPVLFSAQEREVKRHEIRVFRTGESFLGVTIRDITSEEVDSLKLSEESGVYIESVSPESPAEEAGMTAGDVVTEYAGVKVRSAAQFGRLVSETPAGRSVTLAVVSEGQERELSATIGKRGSRQWSAGPGHFRGEFPGALREFHFRRELPEKARDFFFFSRRPSLGISAGNLTEQMARFLGVPGNEGVLVMEVHENTPAARAGLRAGDVITAVDGRSVEDPAELSRRLSSGTHRLEVVRDKGVITVEVDIETDREKEQSLRL